MRSSVDCSHFLHGACGIEGVGAILHTCRIKCDSLMIYLASTRIKIVSSSQAYVYLGYLKSIYPTRYHSDRYFSAHRTRRIPRLLCIAIPHVGLQYSARMSKFGKVLSIAVTCSTEPGLMKEKSTLTVSVLYIPFNEPERSRDSPRSVGLVISHWTFRFPRGLSLLCTCGKQLFIELPGYL
jgi:hypothetical protein